MSCERRSQRYYNYCFVTACGYTMQIFSSRVTGYKKARGLGIHILQKGIFYCFVVLTATHPDKAQVITIGEPTPALGARLCTWLTSYLFIIFFSVWPMASLGRFRDLLNSPASGGLGERLNVAALWLMLLLQCFVHSNILKSR